MSTPNTTNSSASTQVKHVPSPALHGLALSLVMNAQEWDTRSEWNGSTDQDNFGGEVFTHTKTGVQIFFTYFMEKFGNIYVACQRVEGFGEQTSFHDRNFIADSLKTNPVGLYKDMLSAVSENKGQFEQEKLEAAAMGEKSKNYFTDKFNYFQKEFL